MFHRSQRLLLRPIWPEDRRAVLAGLDGHQIPQFLARAPAIIRTSEGDHPLFPVCAITLAANSDVIGCTSLGPLAEAVAVRFGVWIAPRHRGHGFASEAGDAMIRIAKALGHEAMTAEPASDDPASEPLLRKLWFQPSADGQYQLELERVPDQQRAAA
ncbi:MAG: GNAT family N-acetyltransferase [Erythrobacter sp.]